MNKQGQLGVLGVFIKPDHSGHGDNAALATILHDAEATVSKNPVSTPINIDLMLPDDEIEDFWHYDGSLTTPPCSEGVKWYVAKKHIHASAHQIEEMAELLHHHNYRLTQPLNGRVVKSATERRSRR